jgi:hypothetical protein
LRTPLGEAIGVRNRRGMLHLPRQHCSPVS